MSSDLRLVSFWSRRAWRAGCLLSASVWSIACGPPAEQGEGGDSKRFAGEWQYLEPTSIGDGSPTGQVSLQCGGQPLSERLTGVVLLEERGSGELMFIAAPACQVELSVRGDSAVADRGRQCELTVRKTTASGRFEGFALLLQGNGQLWLSATGAATLSVGASSFACEGVEISGLLERRTSVATRTDSGDSI